MTDEIVDTDEKQVTNKTIDQIAEDIMQKCINKIIKEKIEENEFIQEFKNVTNNSNNLYDFIGFILKKIYQAGINGINHENFRTEIIFKVNDFNNFIMNNLNNDNEMENLIITKPQSISNKKCDSHSIKSIIILSILSKFIIKFIKVKNERNETKYYNELKTYSNMKNILNGFDFNEIKNFKYLIEEIFNEVKKWDSVIKEITIDSKVRYDPHSIIDFYNDESNDSESQTKPWFVDKQISVNYDSFVIINDVVSDEHIRYFGINIIEICIVFYYLGFHIKEKKDYEDLIKILMEGLTSTDEDLVIYTNNNYWKKVLDKFTELNMHKKNCKL